MKLATVVRLLTNSLRIVIRLVLRPFAAQRLANLLSIFFFSCDQSETYKRAELCVSLKFQAMEVLIVPLDFV
jgi:hypothetical protein